MSLESREYLEYMRSSYAPQNKHILVMYGRLLGQFCNYTNKYNCLINMISYGKSATRTLSGKQ